MRQLIWMVILTAIMTLILSVTACEQKKTTPSPQSHAGEETASNAPFPDSTNMPFLPPSEAPGALPPGAHQKSSGPKKINVPDDVKVSWESVVIQIKDKTNDSSVDQTIPLHSDYQIPDSNLTIKVGDFLPQFTMGLESITSLSNEAKNPALKITVTNNGQEVFNGWLFERFPDMHPFEDDRFEIALVGYNTKEGPPDQPTAE